MGQGAEFELSKNITFGVRRARMDLAANQKALAEALLDDYLRRLRAQATVVYLEAMRQQELYRVQLDSYDNPDAVLQPLVRDFILDSLLAAAYGGRADLMAAMRNEDVAAAALNLTRKERGPDIELSLGANINSEVLNEIAPAPAFTGISAYRNLRGAGHSPEILQHQPWSGRCRPGTAGTGQDADQAGGAPDRDRGTAGLPALCPSVAAGSLER